MCYLRLHAEYDKASPLSKITVKALFKEPSWETTSCYWNALKFVQNIYLT